MRMKLYKTSQLLLAGGASLLAAGLVTACSTATMDFVYVTCAQAAGSNNYGEVDVLEVNRVAGYMRKIPSSPFLSGGRNPVADAVSPDYQNLYVVNKDDNSIVQFTIGEDGKIYPQSTVNTPGLFPMGVKVSGSNLFVLDLYQPLKTCSTLTPCTGSVAVYPITPASGSGSSATLGGGLGSPLVNGSLNYWPLTLPSSPTDVIQPTGFTVLASGAYLYVAALDTTTSAGYVFGFSVASNGSLTPLNGGVPVAAGTEPTAIAGTPSGAYVYVTDGAAGQVLGYAVQNGTLAPLTSGTGGGNAFPAGNGPSAIAVDPEGSFMYVTNNVDATITLYSIGSGALTRVASYATGLQPVAVGFDVALNKYLYTINFLGNTVSGFEVNPTDGTLINTQGTPYATNPLPTALVAIPHKAGL